MEKGDLSKVVSAPFEIPWGHPPLERDLTQEEIEDLKKRLTNMASRSNVVSDTFIPAELRWIEENVKNCYIIRVSSDIDGGFEDGKTWAVIGADKESALNYYNRI